MPKIRTLEMPDGTRWRVEVSLGASSNALVHFRHPEGTTTRKDRYAWYISHGPEARSVTSRLDVDSVLDSLSDADVLRLFRRSMPVSPAGSPLVAAANRTS